MLHDRRTKASYGDRVKPDHWGTIKNKDGTTDYDMYDVGKNLLFAVSGELSKPGHPVPGKYVPAVGLFDGRRRERTRSFGAASVCGLRHRQPDTECTPSQRASIDQENRVRVSYGASPPGRGPR